MAYVLRTCSSDMLSYGGFRWPAFGPVEAPDWDPAPTCGGGLHGFLWGEGDGALAAWAPDAKWLVVEVADGDLVNLGGKVKFPKGVVVYCGSRADAIACLVEKGGAAMINRTVIGANVTAGDGGTATVGYGGTATAGDCGTATVGYGGTATVGYGGTATAVTGGTATAGDDGTATAGHGGTATAGDCGTASAGDCGTASAGDGGTASAGDRGTASAGDGGTATVGYGGTAAAGDRGRATAGDRGRATVGYGGTASAGDRGRATAGDRGFLIISGSWFGGRRRVSEASVGEAGIEPNVAYGLDEEGKFTKVV